MNSKRKRERENEEKIPSPVSEDKSNLSYWILSRIVAAKLPFKNIRINGGILLVIRHVVAFSNRRYTSTLQIPKLKYRGKRTSNIHTANVRPPFQIEVLKTKHTQRKSGKCKTLISLWLFPITPLFWSYWIIHEQHEFLIDILDSFVSVTCLLPEYNTCTTINDE